MNIFKTLTAGALAVAMTGMASAYNVVHITGAAAFRASATAAIVSQLGANARTAYFGNSTSNPQGKAIYQIFTDGYIDGVTSPQATTIILTDWSGSLSGVVDLVSQNTSTKWIDYTQTSVQNAIDGSSGAVSLSPTAGYVGGDNYGTTVPSFASAPPDASFTNASATTIAAVLSTAGSISPAININGSSVATAKALASAIRNAKTQEAGTNSVTSNGFLAIVPYQWILGNYSKWNGTTASYSPYSGAAAVTYSVPWSNTNAPFSNITQQAANSLLQTGYTPASFFGSTVDKPGDTSSLTSGYTGTPSADFVYTIGRSEDAADRIETLAEAQTGFTTAVIQTSPTFSNNQKNSSWYPLPELGFGAQVGGKGSAIEELDPWPVQANGASGTGSALVTEPSINWLTDGHGGFVNSGDTANALSSSIPVKQANPGAVHTDQLNVGVDGTSTVFVNPNGNSYGNNGLGSGPTNGENTGDAYLVGYIGIADAGGDGGDFAIWHGTPLSYNGVFYSSAAVENGSYTLWSFEHLYYLNGQTFGQIGSGQQAFLDTLANNLATTYAPTNIYGLVNPAAGDGAGVLYTSSSVIRGAEGTIITINY
jgi:hypothetical protein